MSDAGQNPTDEELIAEATAALKGVTPGPWTADERFNPLGAVMVMKPMNASDPFAQIEGTSNPRDVLGSIRSESRNADAAFIAAARTLLPELVERLSASNNALEEAKAEIEKITGYYNAVYELSGRYYEEVRSLRAQIEKEN